MTRRGARLEEKAPKAVKRKREVADEAEVETNGKPGEHCEGAEMKAKQKRQGSQNASPKRRATSKKTTKSKAKATPVLGTSEDPGEEIETAAGDELSGAAKELSTLISQNDVGALESWIAQEEATSPSVGPKTKDKATEALLKRAKKERDLMVKERNRLAKLLHYERAIVASAKLEEHVEEEVGEVEPIYIAGTDEVGVGPLAGPIVACAVILPSPSSIPDSGLRWWKGLDDSKRVHKSKRAEMAQSIKEHALAWSVGIVEAKEVDELNNYQGSIEAMRRAIEGLAIRPDHLLVDARDIPDVRLPPRKEAVATGKKEDEEEIGQTALISGDRLSQSIAAASIIAKVTRDAMMDTIHLSHPEYNFLENKGYGTAHHMKALREIGPCPHHRFSFRPVAEAQAKLEGREVTPPKKRTKKSKADDGPKKDAEGKPLLTTLTNWLTLPWKKGEGDAKDQGQAEAAPVVEA